MKTARRHRKITKHLRVIFPCGLCGNRSPKARIRREAQRVAREMGHGNGLRLPRRSPAKSVDSTRFIAVGASNGVASFLSTTNPGCTKQVAQVCALARRYGYAGGGKTIGKLELGFVVSLRHQTVKPFPVPRSRE
jgi:hypothetical protein